MVRTSTAATASWSNWVRRQNETPNETENQECGVARYQAGESIVILSVTVSRVCLGLSLFFLCLSLFLSLFLSIFFVSQQFVGVWLTVRYRNQKDPKGHPGAFL